MHPAIESTYIEVDDKRIHYLSAGTGDPILLIHGFPTSSYLWRNIVAGLSEEYRIIAIDLPGYGKSVKRIEDSFSFRYYSRILTEFVNKLEIESVTLGVHDFGGPVGLFWMVQNMERVSRLILFNTLVYPKFSWAVKLFGLASLLPGVRDWLSSPNGVRAALKLGVFNKSNLTPEILNNYEAPFVDKPARKVLLKSVQRLSLKGFAEIEKKLPAFNGPVLIIYGEKDWILPKVSQTMKKVKQDLPQSNIISIPNCGHFLQEDAPAKISTSILDFMQA